MKRKSIIALAAMATLSLGELPLTNVAQAAGMFDMMNPSKWFGSNRNRDRDYDYYGPGYGYGPYGYGGPWGGYGGPYGGYGGPWGGYGYGHPYGYGGWGGYPGGYGQGSTIVVNPPSNASRSADTRRNAPRLPE